MDETRPFPRTDARAVRVPLPDGTVRDSRASQTGDGEPGSTRTQHLGGKRGNVKTRVRVHPRRTGNGKPDPQVRYEGSRRRTGLDEIRGLGYPDHRGQQGSWSGPIFAVKENRPDVDKNNRHKSSRRRPLPSLPLV